MVTGLLVVIIGYILGSIPSAFIMARVRKSKDIRDYGVGNMGAANVIRHIGIWEGIVVGLMDIAKGAASIFIAHGIGVSQAWVFGAGFCALLGYNLPVFAGFRGGKGSANILGIFLVLVPKEIGIILAIMVLPFFITRNFAFSLTVGFIFLPLLIWLFGGSVMTILYSLMIIVFIGLISLPYIKQAWPKISKNARDLGDGSGF